MYHVCVCPIVNAQTRVKMLSGMGKYCLPVVLPVLPTAIFAAKTPALLSMCFLTTACVPQGPSYPTITELSSARMASLLASQVLWGPDKYSLMYGTYLSI